MSKVELRYNMYTDLHRLEVKALSHTTLEVARKTPYKQQEFKMLTQNLLHELYTYDADQGKLIYKRHTNNRVKVGNVVGCIGAYGYRVARIQGVTYKHSRLVWLFNTGSLPSDTIDHINGNRDDDRMENLRAVTQAENRKNCAISSQNTSGIQGVSLYKRTGRWRAHIGDGKKSIHLGYFKTRDEAVNVRLQAEVEFGYHENHGRCT